MDFESLAREFVSINVFNPHTSETIIRAADLFDRRTYCTVEDLNLVAIGQFKTQTLRVARPVTYNGYLRYLRLITDHAVDMGYLEVNWFRRVKTAPIGKVPPKLVSDNDLWRLFAHLRSNADRYKPAWFWEIVCKTLYFTGIRRRQLVNLRIGDINFQAGLIHLRYEGSKTLREWSIPLHPDLIDDFTHLMQQSRKSLGRALRTDDPLFHIERFNDRYTPNEHDPELMNPRAITAFFRRLNDNAGLRLSAHKFRHTLATNLCNPEKGDPDIFAVQAILGHTSINTTRNYVSTSTDRLTNVMRQIQMPTMAKKALTHT